jgi:uncharacterized membrane protein
MRLTVVGFIKEIFYNGNFDDLRDGQKCDYKCGNTTEYDVYHNHNFRSNVMHLLIPVMGILLTWSYHWPEYQIQG